MISPLILPNELVSHTRNYMQIVTILGNFKLNKNAFQWDAYRPLVDHMPESAWAGVPGRGGGVPGPGGGGGTWSRGEVYLVGGCTWSGGCLLPGGAPGPRGCHTWSGGCTWSGWVYLVQGGVCSRGGPQIHPPVNRMTNRCKNITLATTSLRPVKTVGTKIYL